MARSHDDEWCLIDDCPDGELSVRVKPDQYGHQIITGVRITSKGVTTAHLRAIPLGRIEATFNVTEPEEVELPPLVRQRGDDPVAFSELVARHYRQCAVATSRPVRMMADRAGVPVATAHSWVREARLRGKLPPGQRGKATA